MPIIYFRNRDGSTTSNNVPDSDVSYWVSQGWSSSNPASSSASTPAPTPAPVNNNPAPVINNGTQSGMSSGGTTNYWADQTKQAASTIPTTYQQIDQNLAAQVSQTGNTDWEDIRSVPSLGAGNSITYTYFAYKVPKATLVNQNGQRVVVRTDGKQGTRVPTSQDMMSQGYRLEKAPGVPYEPFTTNTGNTQTPMSNTAVDQRTQPDIILANGQRITATNPNYSNYLTVPGSMQVNPVTNQIIPNIVGSIQTFADGSQLNTQTGQPVRGATPVPPSSNPAPTFSSPTLNGGTGPSSTPVYTPGAWNETPESAALYGDPNAAPTGVPTNASLIRFPDSPTVYLVNEETHTAIPFSSETAFNAVFGNDPQRISEAWASLETINRNDPRLGGVQIVEDYPIQNDGRIPVIPGSGVAPSTSNPDIAYRYGKANDENINMRGYLALDGFLSVLTNDAGAGISRETLASITRDPNVIGTLLGAMAYGGYTLEDVYKELKRRDLAASGNTSMESLKIIDPKQSRDQYANSTEGKASLSNPTLNPPDSFAGIGDSSITKLKLFQMPKWGFEELVPTLDYNSPEFKTQLDSIESAYHDVLLAQLNANTESTKAAADSAYEEFKSNIKAKLGVTLSDNSLDAWKQIQEMKDQFAGRGISNSGLQNETVDNYLRSVREKDRRTRIDFTNEEESKLQARLQATGSPQDVQALIVEDQAKGLPRDQWRAVKWGLVPSQSVLDSLDLNKLQTEYDLSPELAKAYRDQLLDENGNYRSTLYQNFFSKKLENELKKKDYQQTMLIEKNKEATEKAYFNWSTDPTNMFSSYVPPEAEKGIDAATTYNPVSQLGNASGAPASTPPGTPPASSTATQNAFFGAPSSSSTSTATSGSSNAAESARQQWLTANPGYSYISNPGDFKNYTDVTKGTSTVTGADGKQNFDYFGKTKASTPTVPSQNFTSLTNSVQNAAANISNTLSGGTSPKPTTSPTATPKKTIAVGSGGTKLYAWDGTTATYIPNVAALGDYVKQGYADPGSANRTKLSTYA